MLKARQVVAICGSSTWHESEMTTKSGRHLCSQDMYLSRVSRNFSSAWRSDRPIRRRERNCPLAPRAIRLCNGAAIVGHRSELNATSWPRSSSAPAVRHQSSSLPPQGSPPMVEKKAIRIVGQLIQFNYAALLADDTAARCRRILETLVPCSLGPSV